MYYRRAYIKLFLVLSLSVSTGILQANGDSQLKELIQRDPNIKLGILGIHVGGELEYGSDDNIYNSKESTPDDFLQDLLSGNLQPMAPALQNFYQGSYTPLYFGQKLSDNYVRSRPVLMSKLKLGSSTKFAAGGAVDIYDYSRYKQENYMAQYGIVHLASQFPGGLQYELEGSQHRTQIPRDEFDDPVRQGYRVDNGRAMIGYITPSKKFSINLSGAYNDLIFDERQSKNFDKRKRAGGFSLQFKPPQLPKTTMLFNYAHYSSEFPQREKKDFKYRSDLGSAGLSWETTSKLNGNLSIGYHNMRMLSKKYRDYGAPIFVLGLNWKSGDEARYEVSIDISRDIFESQYYGNNQKNLSASLFYLQSAMNLKFSFKPIYKLKFSLSPGYQFRNYVNIDEKMESRKDNIRQGTFGLSYSPVEWLSFSINHTIINNSSNDNSRNFDKNLSNVKISIIF